jgi:hypothetical protein
MLSRQLTRVPGPASNHRGCPPGLALTSAPRQQMHLVVYHRPSHRLEACCSFAPSSTHPQS